MFNIKFMNYYEDGEDSKSFSCPQYDVIKHGDEYEVIMYPTMSEANGIRYYVSDLLDKNGTKCFQVCYIETAQGKTTQVLRANKEQ